MDWRLFNKSTDICQNICAQSSKTETTMVVLSSLYNLRALDARRARQESQPGPIPETANLQAPEPEMINPYLFRPFWVYCYLCRKHSRNSLCTPETQSPVISYRRLVGDYSTADKSYGRSIQGLWGHRGATSRSEQVRGCSYRENWDVKEAAAEEEKYQEENKSARLRNVTSTT